MFWPSCQRVGRTSAYKVHRCSRVFSSEQYIVEDWHIPKHRLTFKRGEYREKIEWSELQMQNCNACPRKCGVDRNKELSETKALCYVGNEAVVSYAFPHFGEEPFLVGRRGSGTVFFGGCNLRCVFCQNWDISQLSSKASKNEIENESEKVPFLNVEGKGFLRGGKLNTDQLAELFMEIQESGCHNLNLVTPEHVIPHIIQALYKADKYGFILPVVYNTSSYDDVESLHVLNGLVDIYLPDFKFWKNETSSVLARASDYPTVAKQAIKEMHRQVGELKVTREGIAMAGLAIRHLIMPNYLDETESIMNWIAEEISKETVIHLMEQYRPQYKVGMQSRIGSGIRFQEINRPCSTHELEEATRFARKAGLFRFAGDI